MHRSSTIPTFLPGPRPRATPRAFTLIEMFVVVGIIALVIALLIPAISSSRRAAKAAIGVANLRSLGQTMMTYTHDHQEYYLNPFRAEWPTTFPGGPLAWNAAHAQNDPELRWTFAPTCPDAPPKSYTDSFSSLWASFFADYRGVARVAEDQFSPADALLLDSFQDVRDLPDTISGARLFPSSFKYSPTFWTKPERYVSGKRRPDMAPEWFRNNQVSSVLYPSAKVMLWERAGFRAVGQQPDASSLRADVYVATADGSVSGVFMRDVAGATEGFNSSGNSSLLPPTTGIVTNCYPPPPPTVEFFFGTANGIKGKDLPR
jgi:type II secretory pathway pseudopilin PulG